MSAAAVDAPSAAGPVGLEFVNIPTGQASPMPAATTLPADNQTQVAPAAIDANFGLLSLLSPSFWQAAFDVNTEEVLARLKHAAYPIRQPQNFLQTLAGKPDLYIPVWAPASLVFMLNLGSNLASYMQFTSSEAVPIWRSDFTKLVEAAFMVYGFSVGAPVLAWLAMLYLAVPSVGIVSLVCLYGYSLIAFVPAALICVLPSGLIQWLAVLGATGLSTFLVLSNVVQVTSAGGPHAVSAARGLLGLQLVAHIAFGVCLKLFFFTFSPAS